MASANHAAIAPNRRGKPNATRLVQEAVAAAFTANSTPLYVSLSGGMDSVVLLHALHATCPPRTTLHALHIHHGLSPNADTWAEHCAKYCASLNVPLTIIRVKVSQASRTSIEEEARVARFYGLFTHVPPGGYVGLAHHANDQVETVLLQLLRGAGIAGIGAMAERSVTQGRVLLRPLLTLPRATLTAYAHAHALTWIEDESNADTTLKRNFLRHEILPKLEAAFPGLATTIPRSAVHLRTALPLIESLAALDFAQVRSATTDDLSISIPALQRLEEPRALGVLRHWLALSGARAPSAARLGELYRQAVSARGGSSVRWAHGKLTVLGAKGILHINQIH